MKLQQDDEAYGQTAAPADRCAKKYKTCRRYIRSVPYSIAMVVEVCDATMFNSTTTAGPKKIKTHWLMQTQVSCTSIARR